MSETSSDGRSSVFSWWLRTGKLPPALNPDGLELKFNPWHDPADGRFTFSNAGRRDGVSSTGRGSGGNSRTAASAGRTLALRTLRTPQAAMRSKAATARPGSSRGEGGTPVAQASPPAQPHRTAARPLRRQPDPAAEFVVGVGEGLYDVGKATVAGVHAALTTNPATTIRDAGRGIAGMIDGAIAAEDTPARIQVSRAAHAVANASARQIGHAAGTVAGNVALAAVPEAAFSRAAELRRLRLARPRTTYPPPQIGWVKETIKTDKPWKPYNDTAPGARADQAPTLMRTMTDGSTRPVKFDGIQGDYVVDRKWAVRDMAHARAQILRQSAVLAEHRLFGLWEVPTAVQKVKALRILKKLNVTNIHVKVVKP